MSLKRMHRSHTIKYLHQQNQDVVCSTLRLREELVLCICMLACYFQWCINYFKNEVVYILYTTHMCTLMFIPLYGTYFNWWWRDGVVLTALVINFTPFSNIICYNVTEYTLTNNIIKFSACKPCKFMNLWSINKLLTKY